MTLSRRKLLTGAATLAAGATATATAAATAMPLGNAPHHGRARVKTLNGRSLEWRMVDGVKEFHLTAGEFEHEFAPGCKARCWATTAPRPDPRSRPSKAIACASS